MTVRAGTSGFSYKEWKGPFYPEGLPDRQMLSYYAERLPAVEINNTFYRMPREELLRGWAAQVPDGFSFVLKASRRITHHKKLAEVADDLDYLLRTAAVLGDRLGPILFQLPPYLKRDLELLGRFVALLPADGRAAIEFRSASWYEPAVYDVLRAHRVALVAADTGGDDDPPFVPTAPFGYLRLRREAYDEAALRGWIRRIADAGWDDAYVFFKHEDAGAGPRLATRFLELLGD